MISDQKRSKSIVYKQLILNFMYKALCPKPTLTTVKKFKNNILRFIFSKTLKYFISLNQNSAAFKNLIQMPLPGHPHPHPHKQFLDLHLDLFNSL